MVKKGKKIVHEKMMKARSVHRQQLRESKSLSHARKRKSDPSLPDEINRFAKRKTDNNNVPTASQLVKYIDNQPDIANFPTDRAILSKSSVIECVLSVSAHAKACEKFDMSFSKDMSKGISTKIIFTCTCNWKVVCQSNSGNESLNINQAVAMGCNVAPLGHDALKHFLTPLDIRYPDFRTYASEQNLAAEMLNENALRSMTEAAIEERRLAEERQEYVFVGGKQYPAICVITDGSWAKRTYGHSFSSHYGMAVIIGEKTGKVLFASVRQRVCLIHSKYERKGLPVPPHTCSKNWDLPSTAMESDVIREGFQNSISEHGLVYNQFVGDGDSSVHAKVQHVYPGITVKKIECSNHVIRNLNSKLAAISLNKCKLNIPINERKISGIELKFARVVKGIRSAMKYYNNLGQLTFIHNASHLADDIRNIPYHIFGRHVNCKSCFCKFKTGEVGLDKDVVDQMRKTNVFKALVESLNRPAQLAGSLIWMKTSNIAECFMSTVCKYLEGKRKNLGGMGLYKRRIDASVLSFNEGPFWPTKIFENAYHRSPHPSWKKLERISLLRRKQIKAKTFKLIKLHFPSSSDNDYGKSPEKPDIPEDQLHVEIENHRQRLQVSEVERDAISEETKLQGCSPKWLEYRHVRITASFCKTIFKLGDDKDNTAVLKKIRGISNFSNSDTKYGNDNEEVARQAYIRTRNLLPGVVRICGLMISLEKGIFACSPDGLVDTDGLLEIKCPALLVNLSWEEWLKKPSCCLKMIDGVLQLKQDHDYMYQIIMQLFVTGRKWCDFYLWGPDPSHFHLQRIEVDNELKKRWSIMEKKLERFWTDDLAPGIADPRAPRGYVFRCPSSRQADRDKKVALKQSKENDHGQKQF